MPRKTMPAFAARALISSFNEAAARCRGKLAAWDEDHHPVTGRLQ